MAPKFFATGTTGYLGGTVLHSIITAHPDWESSITCLSSLTLVNGTLEDSKILEDEVAKTDIVLRFASSDHVGAALTIKRGLERGAGSQKAAYWIHTSGTDVLLKPELLTGNKVEEDVGEVKVYDDWDGIQELISFPKEHSHRPCDIVPLSISAPNIKTAVICPPTIFTKGRGAGSTHSMQIYELARLALERGEGILIPRHEEGKVKTFWSNVHADDLSRLYFEVIDSAVEELEGRKGKATWRDEGYYFAENGVYYWQDVIDAIDSEAHKQGYLKSGSESELEEKEEDLLKPAGSAIWNVGASCKYIRAKKLFGWEPREKELMDEIAEVVGSEAERGGFSKKA